MTTRIATILREKYSLADVARHREPREYAQIILRGAKVAELRDIVHQMSVIWNGLDLDFQQDIPRPSSVTALSAFLQSIECYGLDLG